MDLNTLRSKIEIPGVVDISTGEGGLTKLVLTSADGVADIYLLGAHVSRFVPKGASDLLFISGKSHFSEGKPIRGGVPIIFPWFGPHPSDPTLPAHGFARNRVWEIASARRSDDGRVSVRLVLPTELPGTSADRAVLAFPYRFSLAFTVVVGQSITMTLEVTNLDEKPFGFEEALHTYLAVSDVQKVKIDGLSGRTFIDKTDGAAKKVQPPGAFGIVGETDRVYLDTPDTVIVSDPAGSAIGGPRVLGVNKESSASTVVWNPWIAKAAAMADFGNDEWPGMLCIESANVASNAITLAPGQSHAMTATIGLV